MNQVSEIPNINKVTYEMSCEVMGTHSYVVTDMITNKKTIYTNEKDLKMQMLSGNILANNLRLDSKHELVVIDPFELTESIKKFSSDIKGLIKCNGEYLKPSKVLADAFHASFNIMIIADEVTSLAEITIIPTMLLDNYIVYVRYLDCNADEHTVSIPCINGNYTNIEEDFRDMFELTMELINKNIEMDDSCKSSVYFDIIGGI